MANAIPVQWLISGSRDNNGNINDSGRIYFFEAGTTNNKTIWADAAKVATYTQTTDVGGPHNGKTYVPLSADGKPTSGEVYADGIYDEYVYDSDNNLIDTISSSEYSIPGTVADTVTSVTASTYSVLDTDQLVLCDTSANSITLTISSAASALDGQKFTFIKTTSDANTVTLNFQGADTVNGQTSAKLTGQYDILQIQSDGSNFIRKAEIFYKGADIASAATLAVPSPGYFDVTGTTGITAINTIGIGSIIRLHFDDAVTLTHHATNLVLPGGQNITTVAGDELTLIEYASADWRLIGQTRPDYLAPISLVTLAGSVWPSFSVHRNASNQSIPQAAATKIQWTTEDFDTNNDFDNATNYRFTPTVAGKYLLTFQGTLNGIADQIQLNIHLYNSSGAGVDQSMGFSCVVDANGSTDYFEIYITHGSAGANNLLGTTALSWWTGSRIA
jgi:hypothetical protein